MTYKELLEQLSGRRPSYGELLQTNEWQQKRNEIILNDGVCQVCKRSETFNKPTYNKKGYQFLYEDTNKSSIIKILNPFDPFSDLEFDLLDLNPEMNIKTSTVPIIMQVHHKVYFRGRLPWDYDKIYLVTLCDRCHFHYHQKYKVKVYDDFNQELDYHTCERCNGAGWFPEYSHVQQGICFLCLGNRFTSPIV